MQIFTPHSTEHLDQVRALMRAFVAWHRERHTQDIHLIDVYFDAEAFETVGVVKLRSSAAIS